MITALKIILVTISSIVMVIAISVGNSRPPTIELIDYVCEPIKPNVIRCEVINDNN